MKRSLANIALNACKGTFAITLLWFFFPLGPLSFPGGVVKLLLRQANINSEEVLLSGVVIPTVGGVLALGWISVYVIARMVSRPGRPTVGSHTG